MNQVLSTDRGSTAFVAFVEHPIKRGQMLQNCRPFPFSPSGYAKMCWYNYVWPYEPICSLTVKTRGPIKHTILKMIPILFRLRSATVVCIATIFGLSKFAFCQKTEVSPEKSIVWGAGLDPRVVVPVRYFYIQAVDSTGQNFTTSPGRRVFL